ncbi:hypothetical protein BK661_09160 [Pseudomonas frederiksbergensis]|uniref:Uncharacterized protein n=1 Tax=Pseudomonas frederiksbergensis TaxID=104087 RepID=A0A423J9A6_9PSED|nr:hypothetical protein [Pseudomonas frederiksbergensis]RON34244.1 hypothetical protein BK661_09160 [Pseudomonas frederiksbergensis]
MSGLESFVVDSEQCATLFRLGRDVEAGLAMIELVVAVQPSFDLTPQVVQQQWVLLLGQMLECQEAQNWLALADYLEYELVQLLRDSLSI